MNTRERFESRFTPPDDAWFCEKSETYRWEGRYVLHPFDEVWDSYQAATEDMQAEIDRLKDALSAIYNSAAKLSESGNSDFDDFASDVFVTASEALNND